MATVRMQVTPKGCTLEYTLIEDEGTEKEKSTEMRKCPGFIAHIYGSNLHDYIPYGAGRWDFGDQTKIMDFADVGRWYFADRIKSMDYADVETRLHSTYSEHDPRNHFGKFATRRNFK